MAQTNRLLGNSDQASIQFSQFLYRGGQNEYTKYIRDFLGIDSTKNSYSKLPIDKRFDENSVIFENAKIYLFKTLKATIKIFENQNLRQQIYKTQNKSISIMEDFNVDQNIGIKILRMNTEPGVLDNLTPNFLKINTTKGIIYIDIKSNIGLDIRDDIIFSIFHF